MPRGVPSGKSAASKSKNKKGEKKSQEGDSDVATSTVQIAASKPNKKGEKKSQPEESDVATSTVRIQSQRAAKRGFDPGVWQAATGRRPPKPAAAEAREDSLPALSDWDSDAAGGKASKKKRKHDTALKKPEKRNREHLPPKIDLNDDDDTSQAQLIAKKPRQAGPKPQEQVDGIVEPEDSHPGQRSIVKTAHKHAKDAVQREDAMEIDSTTQRRRLLVEEEEREDFLQGPELDDESDDESSDHDAGLYASGEDEDDSDNPEPPSKQSRAREAPRWGDEDNKPKRQNQGRTKCSPSSVRKSSQKAIAASRAEQPNWANDSDDMDVKPGVDGRTSDESTPNSGSKAQCAIRWMNKRGLKQRDKKWAEDTHIRMSGGGTVLGILSQRPMVKRVLNGGIDGVHLAMMFINAFPNPELTTIMIRDAFLETAERPGYTAILTRLREDVGYHEILQAIPEKRVSSLRRSLYICVAKHVATNYKLNTATTPVDIATLLGGFNYIYPAENGDNKPYGHPIFIAAIKDRFFKGNKSLGALFPDRFVTSFPEMEPLYMEPEIPAPMLALVATAVHYVIKEFLSGDAGGDFSATVYVDTYQKHMASLDKIKKKKAAYHALMANLYTHCSGIHMSQRADISDIQIDVDALSTTLI